MVYGSYLSSPVTPHASQDEKWMQHALTLAARAEQAGEVPIGAVLVLDDALIAEGWNQPILAQDPTAHAEIVALRSAAVRLGNYRLPGSTLYVTLEPCAMCAGAIVQARVARVVYGAADTQSGAAGSVFNLLAAPALNHRAEVIAGVLGEVCGQQVKAFFKQRRG
jgi:tRNA(adenine34) deaminase